MLYYQVFPSILPLGTSSITLDRSGGGGAGVLIAELKKEFQNKLHSSADKNTFII